MTLLNEITKLIAELDNKNGYPYTLPHDLIDRFKRFREAMQVVADTINDQRGRMFDRKYENGERGQQLKRLEPDMAIERSSLLLMLEFCQDAEQLENYLKRAWKRFERVLKP